MSVQWVDFGRTVHYGETQNGPWYASRLLAWGSYVFNPYVRVGMSASAANKLATGVHKVVRGVRVAGAGQGYYQSVALSALAGQLAPPLEVLVARPYDYTAEQPGERDFSVTASGGYPYGLLSLATAQDFRYSLTSVGPMRATTTGAVTDSAKQVGVYVRTFELALSDQPAASISIAATTVAVGGTVVCTVSLQYPGGNDPVTDVAVRLTPDGKCNVAPLYGTYGSSAVASTDSAGEAKFTLRGATAGSATVAATLEYVDPEVFVTPWPLTASVTVEAAPAAPKAGTCTTYPAVAGVPGVPAKVTPLPGNNWDAGANSVTELDGDVRLAFVQPHAVGAVVGLTNTRDAVGSYTRMSHAFYFHYTLGGRAVYQAMEHGEAVTHEAPHDAASEFAIERANNAVSYYVDGQLLHRSTLPSEGTVLAGCALYSSGDRVPS